MSPNKPKKKHKKNQSKAFRAVEEGKPEKKKRSQESGMMAGEERGADGGNGAWIRNDL